MKNQIEQLLRSEMQTLYGGKKKNCTCAVAANQGSDKSGACSCKSGAEQNQSKQDPNDSCICSTGANQVKKEKKAKQKQSDI